MKLRGVFVDFHFVGDGLRLPEAPKEGVERVDVLHHEHIIHADFHDAAAGGLDCVVGVPEVRRHHHPMGRYRPKLCRAACGVFLDDEVALALEEEVNLLEPPQGCCREFVQGVRLRPKIEEAVPGDFALLAVAAYDVELAGGKGKVGRDALHHGEARALGEHLNPVVGVPLRRARPPRYHGISLGAAR